jgi:hypothetical protein
MLTIKANKSNNERGALLTAKVVDLVKSHKRSSKGSGGKCRHCDICRQAFTPEFKSKIRGAGPSKVV